MIVTLASLSSLLGSVWFAIMLGAVGYIAGNLFPLSWIASKVKK